MSWVKILSVKMRKEWYLSSFATPSYVSLLKFMVLKPGRSPKTSTSFRSDSSLMGPVCPYGITVRVVLPVRPAVAALLPKCKILCVDFPTYVSPMTAMFNLLDSQALTAVFISEMNRSPNCAVSSANCWVETRSKLNVGSLEDSIFWTKFSLI